MSRHQYYRGAQEISFISNKKRQVVPFPIPTTTRDKPRHCATKAVCARDTWEARSDVCLHALTKANTATHTNTNRKAVYLMFDNYRLRARELCNARGA